MKHSIFLVIGVTILAGCKTPTKASGNTQPNNPSLSMAEAGGSVDITELMKSLTASRLTRTTMGFPHTEYPTVIKLIEIGSPAVPYLLRALKETDELMRSCAIMALSKIEPKDPHTIEALIAALGDQRGAVLRELLPAIENLGPQAKAGIPQLRETLRHSDPAIRLRAVTAIGAVSDFEGTSGALDVEALTALLKDPDAEIALEAAETLAVKAHSFTESVPFLLRVFEHSDSHRGSRVLLALGQITDQRIEVVPVIAKGLLESDRTIKISALLALSRVPELSPKLVRGFRFCLTDKTEMVRYNAANLAGQMGSKGRQFVPELIPLLHDSYTANREVAVLAIQNLMPEHYPRGTVAERSQETSKKLYKLDTELQSTDHSIFESAVVFLLREARPAAGYVVQTEDTRERISENFRHMDYLENLAEKTAVAIERLRRDLTSPSSEKQRFAISSLGAFGLAAQTALPDLIDLQRSPNAMIAVAAREASQKIAIPGQQSRCLALARQENAQREITAKNRLPKPDLSAKELAKLASQQKTAATETVLSGLLYYLNEGDSLENSRAAEGLSEIGSRAKPATPKLIELLRTSGSGFWSDHYLKALAAIEGEAAIGTMCELLRNTRDSILQSNVAKTLSTFGAKAKSAVPLMMQNIRNAEQSITSPRGDLIEALGKIGPEANESLPLLYSIIEESDSFARHNAIMAVGLIAKGSKQADHCLIVALMDKSNENACFQAAVSLGEIGDTSQAVVSALISTMQDGRDATGPILALGELGPGAKAAIPALIALLKDNNSNMGHLGMGKIHGLRALGKLGYDRQSVEFLNDVVRYTRVQDFRVEAQKSLDAINKVSWATLSLFTLST